MLTYHAVFLAFRLCLHTEQTDQQVLAGILIHSHNKENGKASLMLLRRYS